MEAVENIRPRCQQCGAPPHPAETLVNGCCTDCWLQFLREDDNELDKWV